MRKSRVEFEWQELHEHEQFPPLAAPSSARHQKSGLGRKHRGLLMIGSSLCLLILALVAATWIKREAHVGLGKIQDELVLAVDAESWAERQERMAASHMPESIHTPQGQEEILSVEVQALRQDMAAVTVDTQAHLAPGAPAIYRQLRFYRRANQGWQPTAPQPNLWGQPQRLETAYFDIAYRSRDTQAVQTVAAELDALYETIRNVLRLPSPPEQKIAIEVVVRTESGTQVLSGREYVTVPSPALLHAPDFLTHADILHQSILLHLIDRQVEEAVSIHGVPLRWHPLLGSMRLWQAWHLEGTTAEWREPVPRWPDAALQSVGNDAILSRLAKYVEWCALHAMWRIAPIQAGIPVFCSELNQISGAYLALPDEPHLIRFSNHIRLPSYWHLSDPPDNSVTEQGVQLYRSSRFASALTITLLDYGAATYGRAQISELLPALREHDDWQTLIPVVFGVSAEEFEAGWLAYLGLP